LYLAQSKGYFKDEGVKVAILEPNDPSVSHFFQLAIFKCTYLL
jgi:ABC-type nitrate/sulfonate/bicarbonate transport system substrate-binding protein